jgi:hypothetical protein
MSAFKANKKGFVYAIKGETNDIILLAYKINKSINNNISTASNRFLRTINRSCKLLATTSSALIFCFKYRGLILLDLSEYML